MIKEVSYTEYAKQTEEILSRGAFLNTAADGKQNTMTIAWGSLGFMWGRPIFTVMVRKSRHTYDLIEKNPEFTVSIPLKDHKAALGYCGSHSGRDADKFADAGLTAMPGQKIAAPAIQGAGLHFECKVVYKQAMTAEKLDPALTEKWYGDNDWHTLYYGEIVAAYVEE